MEFRKFVNLYERVLSIQTKSNPRSGGNLGGSWGQIGPVAGLGNVFGALPTQVTGSEAPDLALRSGGWMGSDWENPNFDLALPSVSKSAQIRHINDKINPILVFLSDGTKLYIPYDSFKRINAQPEVGKTIIVTFQRRNDDTTKEPSKIQTIKCY
jgi:hypothetical protein